MKISKIYYMSDHKDYKKFLLTASLEISDSNDTDYFPSQESYSSQSSQSSSQPSQSSQSSSDSQ